MPNGQGHSHDTSQLFQPIRSGGASDGARLGHIRIVCHWASAGTSLSPVAFCRRYRAIAILFPIRREVASTDSTRYKLNPVQALRRDSRQDLDGSQPKGHPRSITIWILITAGRLRGRAAVSCTAPWARDGPFPQYTPSLNCGSPLSFFSCEHTPEFDRGRKDGQAKDRRIIHP